jgi:Tetratricopeptide repeat
MHKRPALRVLIGLAALLSLPIPSLAVPSRKLMQFGVEAAQQGLWREASFRWERALKEDAANPRLHNNLAVAYESLGKLAEADAEYREATRLLPESRDVHDNRASFMLMNPSYKKEETAPPPHSKEGKVARVTLTVPVPERIDMTGIRRILVTRFVVDHEAAEFDLGKEVVTALRRDLRLRAHLDMIDVDPPALPEQPLKELLANTGFWRKMAEQHEADMIITGETSFTVADRSGYVQMDAISPMTGQRIRRTQFVEREGFILDLRLFFLRGSTGLLLDENHFNGEDTFVGRGTDRLGGMFDLYEQMAEDIRGIVAPRLRQVQRSLFTE